MGVGQTAYKRELAYRCLGIDPKDILTEPLFEIQLRRIARSGRQGSRKSPDSFPLDLLAASEDPDARQVLSVSRRVPASYRRLLPVQAYCEAAGITPSRILDLVAMVAMRQTVNAATIVASLVQPAVVAKTAQMALQDGGWRERRMLQKATGFLGPGA